MNKVFQSGQHLKINFILGRQFFSAWNLFPLEESGQKLHLNNDPPNFCSVDANKIQKTVSTIQYAILIQYSIMHTLIFHFSTCIKISFLYFTIKPLFFPSFLLSMMMWRYRVKCNVIHVGGEVAAALLVSSGSQDSREADIYCVFIIPEQCF